MLKKEHWSFLRGIGNEHLELSRLVWFLFAIAGLGFTGYVVWRTGQFNLTDFGIGAAVLNGGGGAATAAKDVAVSKAKALLHPPSSSTGAE